MLPSRNFSERGLHLLARSKYADIVHIFSSVAAQAILNNLFRFKQGVDVLV